MVAHNQSDEPKKLNELLTDALGLRGLSVDKLAEATDIPPHYLSALISGDLIKLPPAPYVRGYLAKIAEILRVEAEPFITAYKREMERESIKTSGPLDKLPSNRYAFKPFFKKGMVITGLVLILAVAYLVWRADDFLGTPKIIITNPISDSIVVNVPSIKLSGQINPRDKLTINGEEVFVDKNGEFSNGFSLQSGPNAIEFKVKRFLGKEIKVVRQVIYQPLQLQQSPQTQQ